MMKGRGNRKRYGFRWLLMFFPLGLLLSYMSTLISPADIGVLYLFGLSYPFWMLSTLGAVVYFLWRRSRLAIVGIICLFVGWDIHGRYIQVLPKIQEEIERSSALRVMTYNVRLFDLYNWSENTTTRDSIFRLLEEVDADIICFQEFYHTDRNGVFETRDTLLQILPLQNVHEKYTHKMRGQQYFGVVTFSRYPIVNRGEISFETDYNNFCIYSDVVLGDDTLRIYNVHMASIRFQKEDYKYLEQSDENGYSLEGSKRITSRLLSAARNRTEQSEKVAESITSSPYPVVLCGDFNDTPVSYAYRAISENLQDAFVEKGAGIGNTYAGIFPSFRIDYILSSDSLEVASFDVINKKLSDHYPVVADFIR